MEFIITNKDLVYGIYSFELFSRVNIINNTHKYIYESYNFGDKMYYKKNKKDEYFKCINLKGEKTVVKKLPVHYSNFIYGNYQWNFDLSDFICIRDINKNTYTTTSLRYLTHKNHYLFVVDCKDLMKAYWINMNTRQSCNAFPATTKKILPFTEKNMKNYGKYAVNKKYIIFIIMCLKKLPIAKVLINVILQYI